MQYIRLFLMVLFAATTIVPGTNIAVRRIDYRPAATYAVKGTQIIGLNITGDGAIEAQAAHFVDAVLGATPPPVRTVQYPASIPLFSPGIFVPGIDESIAAGVARAQQDTATDPAPVIFGYSQGAAVVSEFKRAFNSRYTAVTPGTKIPQPTFVMIGNIERPNGGFYERFAGLHVPFFDLTGLGSTPTGTAGALPGQITTYDISGQYDPVSDFPEYPVNVLADLNSVLAFFYVHLNYSNLDMSTAVLQAHVGDTAYYMIPSNRLPLLLPLKAIGVPDPILAAVDAPLRVLVEAGYDRTTSPSAPTTTKLVARAQPAAVLHDLLVAIPTGVDDALQEMGRGRPFHTRPAGPYGIGGPDIAAPAAAGPPQTAATTVDPAAGIPAADRHSARSPRAHGWQFLANSRVRVPNLTKGTRVRNRPPSADAEARRPHGLEGTSRKALDVA